MLVLIDPAARSLVRFLRVARGRTYYLAEPPILGIVVIRDNLRIEDILGTVVDASLGHEPGIDGWCEPGCQGRNHGKATIYRVIDGQAETSLSQVLVVWRERFR